MAFTTTPSDDNYQIPTGRVFFTPDGGSRYEMGNCLGFSLSNTITKKEHKRNYGGVRSVDKTTITETGVTAKFTLEEIVERNIAMFALADVTENTDGSFTMLGLSNTVFKGLLEVIGDNNDGPQLDWKGLVQLVPSADFSLIKDNDDYNSIEIEAQVLANTVEDVGTATGFGLWDYRPAGFEA
jgi:hypothetical protein